MNPTAPFDRFELLVPSANDEDWNEAIKNAAEPERQLFEAQFRSYEALRRVKKEPVTPEKLAFLSLWSRLFSLLSAIAGAWDRRSPLGFRVLERAFFELSLNVHVIYDRLGDSPDPRRGTDNLRAYLAWCLWNDLKRYRHALEPANLKDLFDPLPARMQAKKLGVSRAAWEQLVGRQHEIISDQEAELDKAKAKLACEQRPPVSG